MKNQWRSRQFIRILILVIATTVSIKVAANPRFSGAVRAGTLAGLVLLCAVGVIDKVYLSERRGLEVSELGFVIIGLVVFALFVLCLVAIGTLLD